MLKGMLSDVRYRLRALFRRAEMERELEEELRFHLEREAEKLLQAGVAPEEATRRARVAFGGVERVKEESRSGRGTRWLDETATDVRHAGRLLGRSRGFAAVVVLTLALGVGVNTAIFGVLNALLLRPLPVFRPEEVVGVYSSRNGEGHFSVSYPDYLHFRDHAKSLQGLAAHSLNEASLQVEGTPKQVALAVVSANYLSLLGIEPQLGRFFLPEEDREGAVEVAVLSDRLWRTSFGADPGIVGRSVRVNGREVMVIGIAPRSFPGTFTGFSMDLWLPMGAAEVAMGRGRLADREEGNFQLLGRLARGASLGSARVELGTLARQLEQAYPDTHRRRGVSVDRKSTRL